MRSGLWSGVAEVSRADPQVGVVIRAVYAGRCGSCGEPVVPGQWISRLDGAWHHVRCLRERG
jgi:hypothetical protein